MTVESVIWGSPTALWGLQVMDYQGLFNVVVGLAAFLGGWVLNNITKAIERLDSDVRKMPHEYVTKIDYRADIGELKAMMQRVIDRLDGKADKTDTK